jgi:hypothetical protein
MLFTKQPIGTKHYSEMTNKEIRDELSKMIKELRYSYHKDNAFWNDDFVRQTKQVPIKGFNGIDYLKFVLYEDDPTLTLGAIKGVQTAYNLKDTDSISVRQGTDSDGFLETCVVFMTTARESDLEYYSRIKELYLDWNQTDKVYKFISDIKKRTGTDIPYYQAKAAMEILESYKQSKENLK